MKQVEIKLKGGDGRRIKTVNEIPSNTSDLINDSGFINSSYHDSTKQDTLISGTNIKTIDNQSILGSGNLDTGINNKADKVTNAINGNFAGLNSSGNLIDSGKKASDFASTTDLANETTARQNADALKQDKNIVLYDTLVSNWVADTTYSSYGYKADITITGITVSDIGIISFAQAEVMTGNYCGVCSTSANTLTIYSRVNTSITIPTIIISKSERELPAPTNLTVSNSSVTFDEVPNAEKYEAFIDGVSIGEVSA